MQRIVLTPEEYSNYNLIPSFDESELDFDLHDYNLVMSACKRLTESLLARNAIPENRIEYFTNPAYRFGHGNKSRYYYFQQNLGEGQSVIEHQSFIKYLDYFIHGSKLTQELKNQLDRIRDNNYDSDVYEEARLTLRSFYKSYIQKGKKSDFAEEVFKHCLDIGMSLHNAGNVRSVVMSFPNK